MLNSVELVGAFKDEPKLFNFEKGVATYFTLVVRKPFRNANGEYQFDYVRCAAYDVTAKNIVSYFHKNDMVAVRGRLYSYLQDVIFNFPEQESQVKRISSMHVICELICYVGRFNGQGCDGEPIIDNEAEIVEA